MKLPVSLARLEPYLSTALLVSYDLLAIIGSIILSIILRFEYLRMEYVIDHRASLPIVLLTYLLTFYFFRLYRYRWQFAGMEMLWSVLLASSLATGISVFWQYHIDGQRMPISVIILTCLLTTVMVGGQRLLLRIGATHRDLARPEQAEDPWEGEPKRTVILGGDRSTVEVLNVLTREASGRHEVIGILDEDPRHHGSYVRGIRVLGDFEALHELLKQHAVDEVIIAQPNASSAQLREYVLACCRDKVAVRVVPVLEELLGNPSASRGRLRPQDLSVEDLLHRPSVEITLQETGQYVTGKRVLITGAGGSIGSELARQVMQLNPAELILLGHGENSIFHISQELHHTYPDMASRLITVICDVRDDARITHLIGRYRPQVIFHAAAHKHVPMMEENPAEAVTNNIAGTRNVVHAATRFRVERMVLISTDKAVRPSSVMGATKFFCEELLRDETTRSQTVFVTVRFGNVLGSRGSVLPVFQEQILHGGPITVTHPDINRYFMTIPEAVSLVVQAGASGNSGNLFVLNMGRPVRIVDLAENVIRLSGLEPYRDVDIAICGLRPGEKLAEELFTEEEQQEAVACGKMFVVNRPHYWASNELAQAVNALVAAGYRNDDDAVLALLNDMLPSFRAHHEETQPESKAA